MTKTVVLVTAARSSMVRSYILGDVIDWRDANPCTKMVVGINPSAGNVFSHKISFKIYLSIMLVSGA